MLEALGKLRSLFTADERRKGVWVLALIVCMAMLETVGVISIMPFLSVLGRPQVIHENYWLGRIYEAGHFTDEQSFMVVLGIGSIMLVVGSSLFKTLTLHTLNRFEIGRAHV